MLGKHKFIGLSAVLGLLLLSFVITFPRPAAAATGIEPYLSVEGKIVTSSTGINITDGHYNMEFVIYTGCTNNTGSGCTAVWTEDWLDTGTNLGGVTLTSGTYQVNLGTVTAFGTSVPWNTYPLYLSIQIGNQSVCTPAGNFQANCGGDGIMSPYILLTSTPYALNAAELGGLVAPTTTPTASQCLQTASSSPFTQLVLGSCGSGGTSTLQQAYNASTGGQPLITLSTSIGTGTFSIQDASSSINANLFQVNNSGGGTTLFSVGNTGNLTVATSTASATALQVKNNNGTTIFNVNTSTPGVQVTGTLTAPTETVSDIALIQNTGASTNALTVDNSQGVPIITAGNNNLLVNGDFESGTTGWAGATAGGSVALNTDPRYIYSGADSLAITTTTTAHTGAQVTSFNNSMAAGTYTLSFYAAVASGSFATLEASFNALGTNNCLSSATVTTSFTNFSCTYTTSGTTSAVSIGSSGTTALTFYVDAVTVTSAGTNLVSNPGFEGGISGWSAYGTGTGSLAWNLNRQNVYLGIGSLKITITSSTYGAQDSTYIAQQPAGGGTYTLSFYAMATSAINISASLGSGTCTLNSSTASTTGFSEYYCTNVAATASPVIEIYTTAASGTLYIDAVQLISGATLSPYNIGQIQLRGLITAPVALEPTTNSTTALQVDNNTGTSLLTVDTLDSNVTIDNTGLAGTVQIGNTTGGVAQTIGIGNNATASSTDAITIGNLLSTSLTTIQGGTGTAVSIQSGASGTINIGTAAVANTTQIGNITSGVAQTIGIGNNATASSTDAVTIGNLLSTSLTTIQGGTTATGTGAISIQSGAAGLLLLQSVNNGPITTGNGLITLGTTGSTPAILVLGNKNTSGDPTCTPGAIYYSSNLYAFRACRYVVHNAANSWQNLIAGVDEQTFTSSGTWTAPSGITTVVAIVCAGGGSGGGGQTAASGAIRGGGSGGGGGARAEVVMDATAAGTSQSVTVGTSVTGGAASTVGTAGIGSSFGTLVIAKGGGAGNAGSSSSSISGGGGGGWGLVGGNGTNTTVSGGDNLTADAQGNGGAGGGSTFNSTGLPAEFGGGGGAGDADTGATAGYAGGQSIWGGGGGGGGGGANASNAIVAGGAGGSAGGYSSGGGGTAGSGAAGGQGASATAAQCGGGGGGGGTTTTSTGYVGGAGGTGGGGGGGGGGGTTGGTGGAGAAGEVWVLSW